jgi:outer membrane autotransporter protein
VDADANAAALDRNSGGVFVGADATVNGNDRVGVVTGYSRSSFQVDGRASAGTDTSFNLGLYGGVKGDALSLRSAAAFTWHDITTDRAVNFAGFSDHLQGDIDARVAQVFGELGYGLVQGAVGIEPFANLAFVSLDMDGFTERGGAAALRSEGTSTQVTYNTLGVHAGTTFATGGGNATLSGTLGWRHAFGDVDPRMLLGFAGGGSPFAITGVPVADNAAVLEAGVDFSISPTARFGFSYNGQVGSNISDHGLRVNFNKRF